MFISKKASFLSAIVFLGISYNFFTFVTGNLTDSYSVTFQMVSALLIIRYFFARSEIEHPPIYMFIHAVMASCCALMRPVNAGMWIGFGIVLAIRLIFYGKFKNFVSNFAALVLGVIFAFIPAVAYGICNSCLDDMWYGTVLANMQYSGGAAETKSILLFLKQFIFSPSFLIVLLGIASVIFLFIKTGEKWFAAMFSVMFISAILFMNVSLRNDGQYNQLYMVFTLPIIIFASNIVADKINIYLLTAVVVIFTLIGNLQLIKQITKYGVFNYHYEAACDMKKLMDEDPGDLILVTGTHSLYYNVTDTLPHIKYFIIYGYGLHYEVFPDATLMQADSICSRENDYIIVNYNEDGSIYGVQNIDEEIAETLSDAYNEIYRTTEGINAVLYKRGD